MFQDYQDENDSDQSILINFEQDSFSKSLSTVNCVSQLETQNEDSQFDSFLKDEINYSEEILINTIDNYWCNQEQEDDDDDEVILKENFQIREYQQKLYMKGRGKNSIIYLETGTGKTLVLLMFMWHQLCMEKNKKVVFIANTVQLVEQQAVYFIKNISKISKLLESEYPQMSSEERKQYTKQIRKSVRVIHGQNFLEKWNRVSWRIISNQTKVYFLTSQLFLNTLRRGLLYLEEFSLVAFDECHATFDNHPYNCIMREFYFNQKSLNSIKLPVIAGTTASPIVSNKKKVQEQVYIELIQLCSNMDSIFLYIDPKDTQLYLKEAKVVFEVYKNLLNNLTISTYSEYYSSDPVKHKEVVQLLKIHEYCPQFNKIIQFLENCITVLEKKKYNRYIKKILQQIFAYIVMKGISVLIELGPFSFSLLIKIVSEKLHKHTQFQDDYYILELSCLLNNSYQEIQKVHHRYLESSYAPKFQTVLKLLKENIFQGSKSNSNQVLIFCRQRIMAEFMQLSLLEFFASHLIITEIEQIVGFNQAYSKQISPDILRRIDGDEEIESKIQETYKQLCEQKESFDQPDQEEDQRDILDLNPKINMNHQKLTIAKFRKQEIQKILIATNVAEEGLDISSCNFVISFNFTQSSKSFVQMKGRARKSESIFYLLIPDQSMQIEHVRQQQMVQAMSHQGVKELDNSEARLRQIMSKFQGNAAKLFYEQYIIETTQANINTNWSQELVNTSCQQLDYKHSRGNQPIYLIYELFQKQKIQNQFIAFLVLPQKLGQVVFKGDKQINVSNAKSSVALKACIRLNQDGYLSDELKIIKK